MAETVDITLLEGAAYEITLTLTDAAWQAEQAVEKHTATNTHRKENITMSYICLDIGHANGTGARGKGQEEHDLCVKVGHRLKRRLENKGQRVTVLDYPDKSNADDLNKTIAAANALSNVTFGISLHMDASDNASAHGGHVCYASAKGAQLAAAIAKPLAEYMPGRANSTVKRTNLAVLNRTRAPWVLIELGFITNAGDIRKLMDDPTTEENELKPMIDCLVEGILKAVEVSKTWATT